MSDERTPTMLLHKETPTHELPDCQGDKLMVIGRYRLRGTP